MTEEAQHVARTLQRYRNARNDWRKQNDIWDELIDALDAWEAAERARNRSALDL